MSEHYFKKEDVFDHIDELNKQKVGTSEFRLLGIKIICSYSKDIVLSDKGMDRGNLLWEMYIEGKEMERNELFELSTIGAEAAVMCDRLDYIENIRNIHKGIKDKYDPEDEYMESLINDIYLEEGYYEENVNFLPSIHERVASVILNKSIDETL